MSCRQNIPEFRVCQVNEAFTGICAFPHTCYFYTCLECPLFHIPSAPRTKPLLCFGTSHLSYKTQFRLLLRDEIFPSPLCLPPSSPPT